MKPRPSAPGIALVLTLSLGLSGCASGLGGDDYPRRAARRVQEVHMGTVEAVRAVKLQGTQSAVGTAAGGVIGGIAGSGVGDGRGSAVATVLGAAAGGIVGAAVEEAATRKPALEITLRLDSGRLVAVVQEDTGEGFRVGERVRLLESGGEARVTR